MASAHPLIEARVDLEPAESAAEAGFTLIELMVVLLIIAILLAIAIPTFLGVTSSANDRAAQANLTNAITEASSQYQNAGQTFSGILGLVQASAPEFTWTAGNCAATTNCISVQPVDVQAAGDQNGLIMAAYSKPTTTCWFSVTLNGNPTGSAGASGFTSASGATQGGTYYSKKKGTATCTASTANTTAWKWGPTFTSAGSN